MHTISIFLFITSNLIVAMRSEIILEDVLPDLETCSPTQKFIGRCIGLSIVSIKNHLARGVSKLDIPSFEPYYVKHLRFTSTNQFNGDVTFINMVISGLTKYLVNNVEVSTNRKQIKLAVNFPIIQADGTCRINGSTDDTIIKTEEYDMNGYFANVDADITISGEYFWNKDVERHYRVTNVYVKLDIGNRTIHMRNLQDNRFLSYRKISHVNDIWELLKDNLVQTIQQIASNVIMEIANKIYRKFPLDTLMPVYV